MSSIPPVYFFHAPLGPPDRAAYPHSLVCLAEGLREIGIPFFSNIDRWRVSADQPGDFLFRHDPEVNAEDCSAVILDNSWPYVHGLELPPALFRTGRNYRTVFFEFDDQYPSPFFQKFGHQFDTVLVAHSSRSVDYPSNCTPWAFGIMNRILRETKAAPVFEDRRPRTLVSFRIGHPVRDLARERFLPHLEGNLRAQEFTTGYDLSANDGYHRMQWRQTGRRHDPAYFEFLNNSQGCACFGGGLVKEPPSSIRILERIKNSVNARMHRFPHTVLQWDSWRLWESWAAGCVTFHLDLELYGAQLPVMPLNWTHYIGIDLNRPMKAVRRIRDDPLVLGGIARAGRAWALENYGPRRMAERFCEIVFGTIPRSESPAVR